MTPFGRRLVMATLAPVPFLGSALGPAAEPPVPAPADPPAVHSKAVSTSDPLRTLNNATHAAYTRAKDVALDRTGPLILVETDKLVFKLGDEHTETRFTPDLYHQLKSVAHIPLALDVMLASLPDGDRLDDEALDELRHYRGLILDARETIASLPLDPEQARRQLRIVSESLDLIDSLLKASKCDPETRISFTRRMAPLVLANAADAARTALDSLHRHVSTWIERLPPSDRDGVTVVILGRPLPRKDNLAVQYFARRFGQPGEGPRILYAESIPDEPQALDLLATSVVDTQIGADFFGDPLRMHRDLLGDAARDYLPALLHAKRPENAERDP